MHWDIMHEVRQKHPELFIEEEEEETPAEVFDALVQKNLNNPNPK